MEIAYTSKSPVILKYWRICGVLIFGAIVVFCYLEFRMTNTYWHSGPIGEMNHNAHLIGNALIKYQRDHNGVLPSRLSELVPSYITSLNVDCFFWPPVSKSSLASVLSSGTMASKIDNEGAYVYLGTHGMIADLVFYGRTNLWSSNRSATTVVTLTTNLTPRLRSIDDVDSRLSQLSNQ